MKTDLGRAFLIASITVLALLPAIHTGSLFDSDDAIYAQMAREMRESGDYIDNRWCGAVQFEKPPLLLWDLAASMALFGESEWALRIPGTLAAAVALGALFLLARGLGGGTRRAVLSVVLLGTAGLFVQLSRRVMTDLPLVAALLVAAALLVRGRSVLFGVALGVAVLTKGPAAAPLALALAAVGLWARWLTWRQLLSAVGAGLLVAGPWHVVETWRHGGEFWGAYVGYHAFDRATSSVVPGLSVYEVLGVLGSEYVLVASALVACFLLLRPSVVASDSGIGRTAAVFVGVWVVAALAPALGSATRLPHYLLPTLPALALLGGFGLPEAAVRSRLFGLAVAGVGALALATGPATLACWLDPDFGPDTRAVGEALRATPLSKAQIATGDLGNQAISWYAGRCATIVASDPRFFAIQAGVLMNARAGIVKAPPGPLADTTRPRALVTRKGWDPQPFLTGLPDVRWQVRTFGDLVLLTDVVPTHVSPTDP